MKTKTSNYRKHFAFACLLLVAVIICGCSDAAKQKENVRSAKRIDIDWVDENGNGSNEEFTIIQIDSCEYLFAKPTINGGMITHKGNCKFCAERSKK